MLQAEKRRPAITEMEDVYGRINIALGPLQSNAGPQPGDNADAANVIVRRSDRLQWKPDVDRPLGVESRRQDSGHAIRFAIQNDFPANQRRVTAESALPQRVA